MPRPGGDEDAPSVTDVLFDGQFVPRWAHLVFAISSVETEDLIDVCAHLYPDGLSDQDGHESNLKMEFAPRYRPIVGVLGGSSLHVKRRRSRSDVTLLVRAAGDRVIGPKHVAHKAARMGFVDPLLLVIMGVLGYLVVGALTARAMWRINHETVDGTRDTVAVTLGWPIVLASLAATCTADGLHQLVTRPTKPERLQQQHAILQRRISQLERDLGIDEQDEAPTNESVGTVNLD